MHTPAHYVRQHCCWFSLIALLECFLIERSGSMDKDDKSHTDSSSFTVITGAVDDPRITETTPTHKKASM